MRMGDIGSPLTGGIYNHIEIKNELGQIGCCFSSDRDTEVILAEYQA